MLLLIISDLMDSLHLSVHGDCHVHYILDLACDWLWPCL